jgi:hypothetical protein
VPPIVPPLTRPGAVAQVSWQYFYQSDPLAPPLIQVVWTAASGATDYVIRVGGTIIGTSTTTSYVVPNPPERDYQTTFVVSGRNAAGEGPPGSTSFAGHFPFNEPPTSFEDGGLVGAGGAPLPLPFDLPSLFDGGLVPGSPGDGVLIQAHAGEAVLTRETTSALTRLLGANGADGANGLAGAGRGGLALTYIAQTQAQGELDVQGAFWRAEQEFRARFGG